MIIEICSRIKYTPQVSEARTYNHSKMEKNSLQSTRLQLVKKVFEGFSFDHDKPTPLPRCLIRERQEKFLQGLALQGLREMKEVITATAESHYGLSDSTRSDIKVTTATDNFHIELKQGYSYPVSISLERGTAPYATNFKSGILKDLRKCKANGNLEQTFFVLCLASPYAEEALYELADSRQDPIEKWRTKEFRKVAEKATWVGLQHACQHNYQHDGHAAKRQELLDNARGSVEVLLRKHWQDFGTEIIHEVRRPFGCTYLKGKIHPRYKVVFDMQYLIIGCPQF